MLTIIRKLNYTRFYRHSINRYSTIIKMPSLSPTMNDGGIVEWHKKEGDAIAAGDLLCEVQTDKAVVGMEAEEDGILAKILKPKDSKNIVVGEAIAVLADSSEDWKAVASKEISVAIKPTAPVVEKASESTKMVTDTSKSDPEKMGPAARLLLHTHGLQATEIAHSGPHNILLKSDVIQHVSHLPSKITKESPKTNISSQALLSAAYIDLPLTNMRQTIAKRLTASKSSVPHFYATGEAAIDELLRYRAVLKSQGIAVSVNDFVIAACALALRLVPEVNSRLSTDGTVIPNNTVDISVAVASETGLITPIVFGADQLPLETIGSTVRALADKARKNKLQPAEFMGGTFTISNLGMYGIKEFTAIINSPQSAILAVGAGLASAVPSQDDDNHGTVETRMRFTLSADARVVDAGAAARFLGHVRGALEHTRLLGAASGDEAWAC